MKHKNIAIFVPHAGCPHRCSFCDQHAITSHAALPRAADVTRICAQAFRDIPDRHSTQVAFFGGSFTGLPRACLCELLEAVQPFLGPDGFAGVRISTRPDCIDAEILALLRHYRVTAIELGAQSMRDRVLLANRRGHTAQDVEHAASLIRENGFELGLQVMLGLYGSSMEDERETGRRIRALCPDTVRLYPVAVLRGTQLAALYEAGAYPLFSFDEVIELTAAELLQYHGAGIRVIKCGLHASEVVERDLVAGFYHPAFRELCESRIYLRRMQALCGGAGGRRVTFAVHPSCISKAAGHKRCNLLALRTQSGCDVRIRPDASLGPYQVKIVQEE
ncbi:MAG: radical SAM protein [Oscillospiraceae bacterium]|nr:radical SAM protein [Oscillospiraceae bacterium]